jgi:hypothetical protein
VQICQSVEDACQNLNRFFNGKGLKISETKSKVVFSSKKHADFLVYINLKKSNQSDTYGCYTDPEESFLGGLT